MLLNNLFTWLENAYRSMTYGVFVLTIQVTFVAFLGLLYLPSILQEDTASFMFCVKVEKPLLVDHRKQGVGV